MGIETERFLPSTLDKDLVICSICLDVLEDPVELPECQHVFCSFCLRRWFSDKKKVCPLDRVPVLGKAQPPNRTLQFVLDRLRVHCKFTSLGCARVFPVAQLDEHERVCPSNPRPGSSGHSTTRHLAGGNLERDYVRAAPRRPEPAPRGRPTGDHHFLQQQRDNTGVWIMVFGVMIFVLFKLLGR